MSLMSRCHYVTWRLPAFLQPGCDVVSHFFHFLFKDFHAFLDFAGFRHFAVLLFDDALLLVETLDAVFQTVLALFGLALSW